MKSQIVRNTIIGSLLLYSIIGANAAPRIHISSKQTVIGMGQTIVLTATAISDQHHPVPNLKLWPYVDGYQWGATATTNRRGSATFLIPLPNVEVAHIQVAGVPQHFIPAADWIWSSVTQDQQTVYFVKRFSIKSKVSSATMLITCDDAFNAYLNGHLVASGTNLQQVHHVIGLQRWLKKGLNVLAVKAFNGTGPAGLLARLTIQSGNRYWVLPTDRSWLVMSTEPSGWPTPSNVHGEASTIIAPVGQGVWGSTIVGWPGMSPKQRFPVGGPLPKQAYLSNAINVRVNRSIIRVKVDPSHRVGIEYEPWFTPLNADWRTAESEPLIGYYDSYNRNVIRQHCLWLDRAGIDFLLIDWSNNLWGKQHWSERAPGVDQLIQSTTLLLDTYAEMRRQGIPTPQVTLLLGLDNGPTTTMTALNEEMHWIYRHYIQNPKYKGLWVYYRGKPLIVPFNGGGPAFLAGKPPIDTAQFTVRWMASQLQFNKQAVQAGYWSWMDGVIHPIPTYYDGKPEALTITIAFFGDGGWTYPQAVARRGGTTYIEEFKTAEKYRPRFLFICQWNEFAGQPIGAGYGPKHDQYVDCYNIPLSNDIEPTSLTDCAYRGCGGWGFYYQNLTRALVNLYHQARPNDTILAIGNPDYNNKVSGRSIDVDWNEIGAPARSFNLFLDHKLIRRNINASHYVLSLSGLKPGSHTLTVQANEATSRYVLTYSKEAMPLRTPVPCQASVTFIYQ